MGINSAVVTGVSESRCNRIVIEKPKDGVATVLFLEQKLISIDGESIEKSMPGIFKQFDPAEKFDIMDKDGKPTGQRATYGDVFELIRSAYLSAAILRDEKAAAAAAAASAINAVQNTDNAAPTPAPAPAKA